MVSISLQQEEWKLQHTLMLTGQLTEMIGDQLVGIASFQ